ncbi:Type 1 periplasmic binding fold superfamily protein [Candidatus Cyrtobacter comes]|uniref:Type 1 periplasmic binding fold superfamily protein n=1 Tax=Candidatus Cyrtobacter comes TaxID=675776 RepID=A0ABU5L8U7_9RICK|nr:penicillin-binding protein activator [Candidatus Cyrtobacter comes]MDZ5762310.1 Type 1 periplasmic binding fold superfamily protein [Candidatus Cyrtobacter comes]
MFRVSLCILLFCLLSGCFLDKADIKVTDKKQKVLIPGTSEVALARKGVIEDKKGVVKNKSINKTQKTNVPKNQKQIEKKFQPKPKYEDINIKELPEFQDAKKSLEKLTNNTKSRNYGKVTSSDKLTVAVITYMSGQNLKIGQDVMKSVEVAHEKLGNDNINVVFLDINSPNILSGITSDISVIIGPHTKEEVEKVYPSIKKNAIPFLPLTYSMDLVGRDYIYMMGISTIDQALRDVSYAIQNVHDNIYTILPNNVDGEKILELLKNYKKFGDIDKLFVERYTPGSQDSMLSAVQKIKPDLAKADYFRSAFLLNEYTSDASYLKPVENYLKRMFVMGGSSFHNYPNNVPTLLMYFADVPIAARYEFLNRFKSRYNTEPSDAAYLVYDAAALVMALSIDLNGKVSFDPGALNNQAGFEGMNGVFRFRKDGTIERLLSIFRKSGDKVSMLDNEKSSFQDNE